MPTLEPEQEQLFAQLVEATRSVPRAEREPFLYIPVMQADLVQGNGLGIEVLGQDLDVLLNSGLIRVQSYQQHGYSFYVPPEAFDYYDEMKREAGEPTAQVETEVQRYLDAKAFQDAYPVAYARWREAAELLWHADSAQELSTIGHKCREAIQEFVSALIEQRGTPNVNPDKAKTRDRFSAVVEQKRPGLGKTRSDMLDALFNYWRATGDVIQRQEHEGLREREPLAWEDGRRTVFQTAVVMFEADRTL